MFSIAGFIRFPEFTNVRCLMMPFIQGLPESVPYKYHAYYPILRKLFIEDGDVGYLTIDESFVKAGQPHRGDRAKHGRALHTEAGRDPNKVYTWGDSGGKWGKGHNVILSRDTQILIGSSVGGSCAVWDATHEDTSEDGDIGHEADKYPYEDAEILAAGQIVKIGILTPHESLPLQDARPRQFIRIVGSGVHGREEYFTRNPLLPHLN